MNVPELNRIYLGDTIETMRTWPDGFVQTCVTSPPYFGLRDYGVAGQIGLEETPEAFVAKMVEVFREVRRVMRDDGTLWLNLGDSYAAGRTGRCDQGRTQLDGYIRKNTGKQSFRSKPENLKNKDLIGIPWMVAFALRTDGWYLRQDIIWNKTNPMPESVVDRCTKSHEYIFLLSKKENYFYDHKSIKEKIAASTILRGKVDFGGAKGRKTSETLHSEDPRYRGGSDNTQWGKTFDYTKSCMEGRNKRSVWNVSTHSFKDAHFATFPPDLITPCVLAGSSRGGVVLDPFMGAGTTALVASTYGRSFIGCELNPEYKEIAERRIKNEMSQEKFL